MSCIDQNCPKSKAYCRILGYPYSRLPDRLRVVVLAKLAGFGENRKIAGGLNMKSGNSSRGAVHVSDAGGAEAQLAEQQERARHRDPQFLKDLLEKMLLIRRFEEKAAEMYTLGKIGGFCHLYIGQEATSVGAIAPLEPQDAILCSY